LGGESRKCINCHDWFWAHNAISYREALDCAMTGCDCPRFFGDNLEYLEYKSEQKELENGLEVSSLSS
jgi:hypothetical protein